MLRTVEWCNIGGYDRWWARFAREQYESVIHLGVEPVPAAFYLFGLARSNYALRLLSRGLDRLLDALRLPEYQQPFPWRIVRWRLEKPAPVDHFAYAASLAFSMARLHPQQVDDQLIGQALDALLRHQSDNGAWYCWADDTHHSIDTTAMAIHALALLKPRGWEISTSAAAEWLWSMQEREGCWMPRMAGIAYTSLC